MLDESIEQLEHGNTISLTMDEMKALESDEWKPSQKILDFMEKNKIEWDFLLQNTKVVSCKGHYED